MSDTTLGKGVFNERSAIKKYPPDVIIDRHHDPDVGRVCWNGDLMSHQQLCLKWPLCVDSPVQGAVYTVPRTTASRTKGGGPRVKGRIVKAWLFKSSGWFCMLRHDLKLVS